MLSNNDLKAVCTVTELVRKLNLSRARFYQLQKKGAFPEPVYCINTKRPFYPLGLQQKCIDIRNSGIGADGKLYLFYSKQSGTVKKPQNNYDNKHKELADTLNQMGLNITTAGIKTALKELYPQTLETVPVDGQVIGELFRYFRKEV